MRYLALDVGTKRIGVAISDKTNTIAVPLRVIDSVLEEAIKEIGHLIVENDISHIIIGKPINMDGSFGFATKRSEDFKDKLVAHYDIPIIMVDERLTTVEAENILITNDYRRKKRKKVIDGVAATLILETFLRMKGEE